MLRFRTAALSALLLSLVLNACSGGQGGMLPTTAKPGGMPALTSSGTMPQATASPSLPVLNCPSIVTPGAARIGIHTQPTQRLGGSPTSGGATLPARQGCGNGIARPKRTMAWSGCSSGQQDFGCNAHQSPGDGMVWVPEACAWLAGYQGQESCTPGFWESGCASMGLPSNCGGGGSGYTPGGPPCQPISSCIAFGEKPQDGKSCNGSQYKIGSPIAPANENSSNTGYYVNNISAITQNGLPVAYVYQVNEANSATNYYFIQITNNATNQFTVGLGIGFGPVNISLSDTYGVSSVSAPQWFFPGQTPLPSSSVSISCWPAYPMPS